MPSIALNLRRPTVRHSDQNPASIGQSYADAAWAIRFIDHLIIRGTGNANRMKRTLSNYFNPM